MDLCLFCLNARYCLGQDGEYRWQHRFPRIATLLRRLNPDVIALQEILSHQRSDLENAFPNYHWVGTGREKDLSGEQCLLGISVQFELLESDTLWLSPTPKEPGSKGWDACLPRIATTAKLRRLGQEFRVVNVHLDHLGTESRRESLKLLQNMFWDERLIFVGDLNAPPESPAIQELLRTFRSGHLIDSRPTYHDYGRSCLGLMIDYILYRGPLTLERFEVLYEQAPHFTSDHFPILANLRL